MSINPDDENKCQLVLNTKSQIEEEIQIDNLPDIETEAAEETNSTSLCDREGEDRVEELLETDVLLKKKKRDVTIDVVNDIEPDLTEFSETGSVSHPSEKPAELETEFDVRELAAGVVRHVEDLVRSILVHISWTVCHFHSLPRWLQDNDFIQKGYRPPLPSFWDCLKSIFSIHTETGNIWTHMLGCIAFMGIWSFFLSDPDPEVRYEDKLVFTAFFLGACVCLGLSTCFHTFLCHSEWAGQLFSKLDYVGIALLIMGSFVPWLYYSFYCALVPRIIYLSFVTILGITSVVVSLWPKFGEPKYRPLRAGTFMSFGLSGVIPAVHYAVAEGWLNALSQASLGWLMLMGFLYIMGTMFYALRIPERFFPGKFDIWFQSHQIFHVFVVAAAFVHYHGISEMAMYRLAVGECPTHIES